MALRPPMPPSEAEPIDTDGIILEFGKHQGQSFRRLPVSYLNWAVSIGAHARIMLRDGRNFSFGEVAKAELERRGERLQDVEVSSHAVDRASTYFLDTYVDTRTDDEEGLWSWLERNLHEIWAELLKEEDALAEDVVTVKRYGFYWVIKTDLIIPALLTVKKSGRSIFDNIDRGNRNGNGKSRD